MRKALGLLAWTSLAATGLWVTLPGGTTRPVSADQPTSVTERGSSLSRINPFSRSRSNKASASKEKESNASYREQAEKMLKDAQALALRGDLAGARQLAERAQSFPVEWGPKDRSPARFLAQLEASISKRVPETAIAAKPSVKPDMTTASTTKPKSTATTSKPFASSVESIDDSVAQATKSQPTQAPIQQVTNVELIDEPTDDTAESVEEAVAEVAAPVTKRPSGPSSNEKMSLAKSLMQQARRDLKSGDIAAARDKANQAAELDVAYNVFDERPEQLLADIDRRANNAGEGAPRTQAVAGNQKSVPTKPAANKATVADPFFDEDDAVPAKKPVAVTAKKPAAASFTDLPFEDDAADAKQPTAAAELPNVSNDKQMAQHLLKQAKAAARKGDLEQARSLALEAKDLNVTYSLFDERPEQVLAQVDRASNNLTIAKGTSKAKAAAKELIDTTIDSEDVPSDATSLVDNAKTAVDSVKGQAAETVRQQATPLKTLEEEIAVETEQGAARIAAADKTAGKLVNKVQSAEDQATAKVRQQAMTSLQQARQDLQAGRVDTARQKALAAKQLNATFGLWDDRPEALLDEIDKLAQAQKPVPLKKTEASESKVRALALLKQARADLAAGRISDAQEKAAAASEMNVAFDVFDDRPEQVLAAIQRVNRNTAAKTNPAAKTKPTDVESKVATSVPNPTPSKSLAEPTAPAQNVAVSELDPEFLPQAPAADDENEPANVAVIHPEGPSAAQLFREGQIHLQSGNKAAAYQAFSRAYQSGQKLDARRSQQLQDYLRELSPRRRKPIQLVSGQATQLTEGDAADGAAEPRPLEPQRPIDIASERQKVQVDRLRSEVLNAVFRADRLREKEPAKAIDILDQAMANLESASMDKQVTASLASTLRKTRSEIEGFQKQMEPNISQNKRNDEVKDSLDRERKVKSRIEREFANLVKEYNERINARQFAEAEKIGKQARELAPDNPVAEVMVLKATITRRNESNNKLKDAKEAGFWGQLDSVEHAAIPFDDRMPIEFGNNWKDITERRRGKYGTDMRIRAPEEQRIESKLSQPVTLHFENAPLKSVITHIATLADVNVVLDESGLADEAHTLSTPVSIDVQGIQLKNALGLLLEPLNMGYTITKEVLMITSEQRLQGKAEVVTYSVADLVVPINPGHPAQTNGGIIGAVASNVGGQMSVPSTGGLQGGQFQVGTPAASAPWAANASPTWQTTGSGHDFTTLIDLITSTCGPESWQEMAGSGHIKGNETTLSLVIRQTQKVHDEIRDLLEQLRRLQDLQVTIEVRFVTVSDNFFERVGIDFDFDLASSFGGPKLYSGQNAGGQQGGQGGGQQGQQGQQGGLIPIPPFGTIIPTQQQQQQGQQGGQQGQQGQQAAQGGTFFSPSPSRQFISRTGYGPNGKTIGLGSSTAFTQDTDIAFRQGSFGIGVPDFGRFDANAGMSLGFAVLSDIETFFFINAAQGDKRSNIMSAPKVTLFNGQTGFVQDISSRPYVASLTPVVGAFAVGYQPQIGFANDGVTLQVQAVISADRRYVRLAVTPNFSVVKEFFSFTFVGASGGQRGGQGGQGGGQGGQGGGQGGQGGGQGGQGGGQGGFGGIGGGAGMEYGGVYNHGLFGQAMGDRTDLAMAAQSGFGGIGGGGGGGVGGGGGGGGVGGGGGGGQQGQGGGFQAAGAGEITIQQPLIATTSVLTTVAVPDGGTVLLGGVKRLSESRNMAGVPILNKIPYLSRLFKNTGVGRETSSLMMMVTPRIVILEEEETLLGIINN